MALFHDTFITLLVRSVKSLSMEVVMPMTISSHYLNVNKNAHVSEIGQNLYGCICNNCYYW